MWRHVLCGVGLVALAACHENGQLAAPDGRTAHLTLVAAAGSAGEKVDVTLSWLRQPSQAMPLTSQTFNVTGTGEQALSVSFDLTECLADPEHVVAGTDGCSVVGTVTLRSAAGDVLDNSAIGPLAVSIGGSAEAAVTLRAVGTVTVVANSSMRVLDTVTVQAVIRDRENVVLTGRPVSWSSSNTAVATINSAGKMTTLSVGTVTITATSQGVIGTKQIDVTLPPVATVAVSFAQGAIVVGQTEQTTVVLRDAVGQTLQGRVVTYQSSNSSIVSVSATGLVTGIALGSATITATSETKFGSASVAVVVVPFAIADANQPGVTTYTPPGFNAGGGAIQVTRQGVGTYLVQFTALGTFTFGSSWGVTVSAANTVANANLSQVNASCNVASYTFDAPLRVRVRCESPVTRAVVDAPFKLIVFGDADARLLIGPAYAFSLHSDTLTFSPYVPASNAAWNSMGVSSLIVPDTSSEGLVVEHRHNYAAPGTTLSFITPLVPGAGQMVSCSALYQLLAPVSTSAIVCFSGLGQGVPVKSTHFLVKANAPPPGHVGGGALVNGANGALDGVRSWSTGSSVNSVRTAVGKYTVTFAGLTAVGTTVGVMVSTQSVGLMVTCAHYLQPVNPVTVDVACVDAFGAFTDQTGSISVLVLK